MTEIARKPVTSELKSLGIGQVAVFPIEQLTSVKVTCHRLKKELARIRWDCRVRENLNEYTVIVERVR